MSSVPSPPYLSPSFETIEARLWAMDTINNVFSKPTNVELPPPTTFPKLETPSTHTDFVLDTNTYFLTRSGTLMDMEAVYINTTLIPYNDTSNQNSKIDTASFLSSSLSTSTSSSSSSSLSCSDRNQQENHTYTPRSSSSSSSSSHRHSFLSSSTTTHPIQPPQIQQQPRQRPRSSSTTLLLSLEPTTSNKILSRRSTLTRQLKRHWTVDESTTSGVRRLFISQQQLKERKAQTMWREKLHEYLIDTAFKGPTSPRLGLDSPRLAFCIVSEMLATEETYLGHLSVFKQMIIDPFLKAFQHRYMIRDLHPIFSHIPQLITLSTSLVHRWCLSVEQHTYTMKDRMTIDDIGKTFCDLEAEFKVYTYYAVHYTKAQKCLTRIQQKPVYQQWIHAVLQTKETKRMGLGDYLIAPIQRITRYCLLLKNLIKHTGGQDIRLERALKYLTALAATMNDCQY